MKEFKSSIGIIKSIKKEINNNWYYLLVGPEPKSKNDKFIVYVYAYRDGREMDNLKPLKAKVNFDISVTTKTKKRNAMKSMESIISSTVNEAVCKLENKQEDSEILNNKIDAALEANKEVHELN